MFCLIFKTNPKCKIYKDGSIILGYCIHYYEWINEWMSLKTERKINMSEQSV